MSLIRLQKLIADAGICSRRKAEKLILAGRVRLDGRVVSELGVRADPEKQRIEVDDQQIQHQKKVYYLINKPQGYITSTSDEAGRPVVFDLVEEKRRLFTAGRLDYNTEGALLLTNDGDLVQGLTHPSRMVAKEYEVKIRGGLNPDQLNRIMEGVILEDGPARPVSVEPLRKTDRHVWYSFILTEGRNRELRRIVEAVGGTVLKLKRLVFAGLSIEDMPVGAVRPLSPGEILDLYDLAGLVDENLMSVKSGGKRRKREGSSKGPEVKGKGSKKRGS